ncbi:hypothetical protein [Winogradskyella sediminis]|uniref:hypothetical protein n=1 Tax=Winogradskyella sediminis TaxID=1382466 RepID=UPI003AA86510
MDFFKFGQKSKYIGANEVFDLCKNTSLNFDFNLPASKDNIELYDVEFAKSQNFTALLICCSMVYFKSQYKDNVYFNPHEENGSIYLTVPFYKKLIELILNEAKLINTEVMFDDLGGGFDGEDYFEEDTEQYLTMGFLFISAHEVLKFKGLNNSVLRQLAYNYFELPGKLRYSNGHDNHVTNEKKLELFANAIQNSFKTIILYLEHKVIDYNLDNDSHSI